MNRNKTISDPSELKQKYKHKGLTEKEFLQTAYVDSSLKNYVPITKEYNGRVLASNLSKLIGSILDPI